MSRSVLCNTLSSGRNFETRCVAESELIVVTVTVIDASLAAG